MERDMSFDHTVEKIITLKQGHFPKWRGQILYNHKLVSDNFQELASHVFMKI